MILFLSIALFVVSLVAIVATLCAVSMAMNERQIYDERDRLRDSLRDMSLAYKQLERSFDAYRHTVNGFVEAPCQPKWMERM